MHFDPFLRVLEQKSLRFTTKDLLSYPLDFYILLRTSPAQRIEVPLSSFTYLLLVISYDLELRVLMHPQCSIEYIQLQPLVQDLIFSAGFFNLQKT